MSRTTTDEVHSDLTDLHAATTIALKGDANSDGAVDVTDVNLIGRYVVDETRAKIDIEAADMNDDSAVDVTDLNTIGRVILR